MIVKCISLLDASGQTVDSSPWLKLKKEYVVLGIEENSLREKCYLVETRSGKLETLGFFSSLAFKIVDKSWPETWVKESINGEISIAPRSWQRTGFWEDFYDGESQAVDTYRKERDKILVKAV